MELKYQNRMLLLCRLVGTHVNVHRGKINLLWAIRIFSSYFCAVFNRGFGQSSECVRVVLWL